MGIGRDRDCDRGWSKEGSGAGVTKGSEATDTAGALLPGGVGTLSCCCGVRCNYLQLTETNFADVSVGTQNFLIQLTAVDCR